MKNARRASILALFGGLRLEKENGEPHLCLLVFPLPQSYAITLHPKCQPKESLPHYRANRPFSGRKQHAKSQEFPGNTVRISISKHQIVNQMRQLIVVSLTTPQKTACVVGVHSTRGAAERASSLGERLSVEIQARAAWPALSPWSPRRACPAWGTAGTARNAAPANARSRSGPPDRHPARRQCRRTLQPCPRSS